MSNWILKATEDYLTPVYEQLHKELIKRDVLHADETTLQVLHEPGKKPQSDSYFAEILKCVSGGSACYLENVVRIDAYGKVG